MEDKPALTELTSLEHKSIHASSEYKDVLLPILSKMRFMKTSLKEEKNSKNDISIMLDSQEMFDSFD